MSRIECSSEPFEKLEAELRHALDEFKTTHNKEGLVESMAQAINSNLGGNFISLGTTENILKALDGELPLPAAYSPVRSEEEAWWRTEGHEPGYLYAFIGGHHAGPSYEIKKVGHYLSYTYWRDGMMSGPKTEVLIPSVRQWDSFWKSCTEIGVELWEEEYNNAGVVDGTNWSLDVEWRDLKKRTFGSNAYPDEPHPDYEYYEERYGYPRPFRRFLLAVQRLTGFRDFE